MKELLLHIEKEPTKIAIGRGLIENLSLHPADHRVCIVDENVYRLHGKRLENLDCIVVPQGEQHKSLTFLQEVYRQLLEKEADRSSFIVGIGGGLVTDLVGYAASTYMRGLKFGFISTTLLGQVDASIGGKNGVNLDGYKNMIGVIRQPEFIWCDLDLLQTLDSREMVSGFAEIIKYGAIRDRQLFELLEGMQGDIQSQDHQFLEEIISRSASIKVEIVEGDVFEKGDRKLLNFGHTLGHAIEKLTGMLHGEAIAIGMVLAAKLSLKLGFLHAAEVERLEDLIRKSGLPTQTDLSPQDLFNTLLKDKKRSGDAIHFILLKSIGEAFIHSMKLADLKTAVNDLR